MMLNIVGFFNGITQHPQYKYKDEHQTIDLGYELTINPEKDDSRRIEWPQCPFMIWCKTLFGWFFPTSIEWDYDRDRGPCWWFGWWLGLILILGAQISIFYVSFGWLLNTIFTELSQWPAVSIGGGPGWIAVGQGSWGIFSFGQLSVGFVSIGQLSVGIIFSIGQLSASCGWCMGQVCFGTYVRMCQIGIGLWRTVSAQFGLSIGAAFF